MNQNEITISRTNKIIEIRALLSLTAIQTKNCVDCVWTIVS